MDTKTKLRKGDQVQIMSGKNRGKRGRILQIYRGTNRVIVDGQNMVKKNQKPKSQSDKGGIIEIEAPVSASNVQILCKKCGATRIGWEIGDKLKTRVCRKCGEAV